MSKYILFFSLFFFIKIGVVMAGCGECPNPVCPVSPVVQACVFDASVCPDGTGYCKTINFPTPTVSPGGPTVCGGTRGSCGGSCSGGGTCSAPSNPQNGDSCSCVAGGGGCQTGYANGSCCDALGGVCGLDANGNNGYCCNDPAYAAPSCAATHWNCTTGRLGWTNSWDTTSTSYQWNCVTQSSPGGGAPGDVACSEAGGNSGCPINTTRTLGDVSWCGKNAASGWCPTCASPSYLSCFDDGTKSSCDCQTVTCVPILNTAPTFSSLILRNNLGTVVAADANNRNNICQSDFNNSQTVRVTINAADVDGVSSINDIQLRWNGIYFNRDSFANGVANFSYTFNSNQNNNGTFNFQVMVTDIGGLSTGWINTGRLFKVWDCNVPVSYNIFDGTDGQACNNTGFSVAAGAKMQFTGLTFKDMSGGNDTDNSLVWSDSYLPLVNGGNVANPDGNLMASSRFTRLIDTGVGTTTCPSGSQFNTSNVVSAYSMTPRLVVDLSYVLDQEGWFQGSGLDIKAKNEIASGVPITANSTLIKDNLLIGSSNAGVVISSSFRNSSGWNDNTQFGALPNNWRVNSSFVDSHKYSYQTLYNDYFVKFGAGTTQTNISTGDTGIVFVNGDLNITSDIAVPLDKYLMVVVNGSVNIDQTVNRVEGIYIANGGINALGASDTELTINGILYAANNSNIRLARSYTDKRSNNTLPAVVVNYRPDMVFALPGRLNQVLSGWTEN